MGPMFVCLSLLVCAAPILDDDHLDNPVYQALLNHEVQLAGVPIRFEPPSLRDDQSPKDQESALRTVAGSDAKAGDLLRDSVSAPFILKLRDLPSNDATLVRMVDLWFVVHADLDALDPALAESAAAPERPVEAGNMRFSSVKVSADTLKANGLGDPAPERTPARNEWYLHMTARLLDRIQVEATDRIIATRSADALVIASRTAEPLGIDGPLGNRWHTIERKEGQESLGEARPYEGGAGYIAIQRYKPRVGVLLVEAHFAFTEPAPWFQGAPILRSKIGLVAQDRIRSLRRDLAKRHTR